MRLAGAQAAREASSQPLTEGAARINVDPLLSLAALRLVPENANASVRLELLRERRDNLGAFVHERNWPNVAAEAIFPGIRKQEDAPAHPFTDRVVGPRGAAVVLPGPVQDAVFSLRMLLRGLFLDVRPLSRHEHRRLAEFASAVLAVADGVSARAGLEPFIAPLVTHDIFVPDIETLARLSQAVTWTDGEIQAIERGPQALEALAGSASPAVERRGRRWLIAGPELLVAELNHLLVADFLHRGQGDDLQERYDDAVWSSVLESMARLGATEATTTYGPTGRRGIFKIDDEHAVVAIGPRSSLAPEPVGRERVMSADAFLAPLLETARPSDVVLAIGQPLADPYYDCAGAEAGPFGLAMAAADLEVLARLRDSTPYSLLRFARSAAKARARGGVTRFSTLDEYELYRQLGERHVQGPPGEPIHHLAGPGSALPLRIAAARNAGIDAVAAPEAHGVVEVTRRYRGVDLPVYLPPVHFPVPARIAKMGKTDLWLVGEDDADGRDLDGILDSLAVFGAMTARDRPDLLGQLPPVLTVHIALGPLGASPSGQDGDTAARDATLMVRVTRPSSIQIVVDPSFQDVAKRADNEADRALLAMLLTGIRALHADPDPADIAVAVDAVLPTGRRRVLVAVDPGVNAAIGPPDTPPWRAVSRAEVALWHEELASGLLAAGYGAGRVHDRNPRLKLLARAVQILFHRLEREAHALAPGDSVVALINRIEAIYRAEGVTRLNLVTAPAVFGEASGEVTEMRFELLTMAGASVATRFLLEYLAARPPTGAQPLTNLTGDRLCALSTAIVELGNASDAVWLGSFEGEISIDPSGRLAVSDSGPTHPEFLAAYERWTRSLLADAYEQHWPVADSQLAEDVLSRMDAAWAIEFGSSLREVATFLNAAMLLADDHDRSILNLPRETFTADVSKRLGWSRQKVDDLCATLTLEPRKRFLAPPTGFGRSDVYPWRFNRPLSYLRRPFVHIDVRGERHVAYGTRQLYVSGRYLMQLVASGRLIARTQPMRELMGQFASSRSRAFAELTAAACTTVGLQARVGFRKLAGTRIGGAARDLGDIDVLAVDPARRRIWLIECKAMAAARTPWEIAHELEEFGGERGHIARHARRVGWVREHLVTLQDELGLDGENWVIAGLVVTDMPVPTAYRRPMSDLQIVDISDLSKALVV